MTEKKVRISFQCDAEIVKALALAAADEINKTGKLVKLTDLVEPLLAKALGFEAEPEEEEPAPAPKKKAAPPVVEPDEDEEPAEDEDDAEDEPPPTSRRREAAPARGRRRAS